MEYKQYGYAFILRLLPLGVFMGSLCFARDDKWMVLAKWYIPYYAITLPPEYIKTIKR